MSFFVKDVANICCKIVPNYFSKIKFSFSLDEKIIFHFPFSKIKFSKIKPLARNGQARRFDRI